MRFTINGTEYEGAKYDFNTYCTMAEMGVDVDVIFSKPLVASRAYLAVSGNMTLEQAGDELEAHFIAGGNIKELSDALAEELQTSGFFQTMVDKMKAQAEETLKKKKVKRKKEEKTTNDEEVSTNP